MKVKIVSKTYYVAETLEGDIYSVDINDPIIKNALNKNKVVEGKILIKEKQIKNGNFNKEYIVEKKFIPYDKKIKKINLVNDDLKNQNDTEHIKLPKK